MSRWPNRSKRHRRHRATIICKNCGHAGRQADIAVEPALEFNEHGDAPADEIAEFAKRHHPIVGAAKRNGFELRRCELVEPAFAFGEAAQYIVVMHHGLAIGRDLYVDFDAVVGGDGGAHRGRRVLDHAVIGVVQPAMSDWTRNQPVEVLPHRLTIPRTCPRPRRRR